MKTFIFALLLLSINHTFSQTHKVNISDSSLFYLRMEGQTIPIFKSKPNDGIYHIYATDFIYDETQDILVAGKKYLYMIAEVKNKNFNGVCSLFDSEQTLTAKGNLNNGNFSGKWLYFNNKKRLIQEKVFTKKAKIKLIKNLYYDILDSLNYVEIIKRPYTNFEKTQHINFSKPNEKHIELITNNLQRYIKNGWELENDPVESIYNDYGKSSIRISMMSSFTKNEFSNVGVDIIFVEKKYKNYFMEDYEGIFLESKNYIIVIDYFENPPFGRCQNCIKSIKKYKELIPILEEDLKLFLNEYQEEL